MPGKYHKQSIPPPGPLRKAALTGRLTWVGAEPIHKMFRGPLSAFSKSKSHLGSSFTQKLPFQAPPMGQKGLFYAPKLFWGIRARRIARNSCLPASIHLKCPVALGERVSRGGTRKTHVLYKAQWKCPHATVPSSRLFGPQGCAGSQRPRN